MTHSIHGPSSDKIRTPAEAQKWEGPATAALIAGWALLFCYVCGMRGLFALDQSIVFDGAYRILQGQTPYRDFALPYGPAVLWLQAAVFALFGVGYQVYVLTAAVLNAIGALLAYGIIRRLAPERRWLALAAGLMTGTWLYGPMATPYPEQTGFIAVLAAVTTVLFGMYGTRPRRWSWLILGGISLGGALLCKTNAGIFGIPAVLGLLALWERRPIRAILADWTATGLGIALVLGSFSIWLFTASDPAMFRHAVFETAGSEGAVRLFGAGAGHTVFEFFTGKGNDLVRIFTVSALSLLVLGLGTTRGTSTKTTLEAKRLRILTVLALALAGYQNLFSLSSCNNGCNEVPFIGLIWALAVEGFLCVRILRNQNPGQRGTPWIVPLIFAALGVTLATWRETKSVDLVAGAAVGALMAWYCRWGKVSAELSTEAEERSSSRIIVCFGILYVALAGIGATVGIQRQVQDVFNRRTSYVAQTTLPALRGLRWAVNPKPGTPHANWSDFENVVRTLQEDKGRFFVLGDYTVLYGVVGRPSVGPLLWFHKGLTYPQQYDQALDERLALAITNPDVTQLVEEEQCFMGGHLLEDFALLRQVVAEQFHPSHRFGLFQMYERNPAKPISPKTP